MQYLCLIYEAESALPSRPQIVGLYRRLFKEQPGAVIGLNYAVALMMAKQLHDAKRILSAFQEELQGYSPYYAALAKLYSLAARDVEAAAALKKAAAITGSVRERRHYQLQLVAIENGGRQ